MSVMIFRRPEPILKCRGEPTVCLKFHACLAYLQHVLKIRGRVPLFLKILLEKNILFYMY